MWRSMRVLSSTLYVLLVLCSVVLFQCVDEDEKPAGVEVSITADKTTVTFPLAGGNYEVKITSSGDWSVKEEIAWLEAQKINNTLLKVTCEANTGTERSGKVTATIEEESVEITVTQKGDQTPSFEDKTIDDQTYVENRSITDLTLPEATGGNGTLTYSLTKQDGSALPVGLSFDASTRVLSGTPTTVAATATYTYTATDADDDEVTLTFMITVEADATLTFGDETIADQTYLVNSSITIPAFPAAMGGRDPLTYNLSPELPMGLSFDASTRVLSGTPTTVAATATYTYTATDADDDEVTLTFMIAVEAGAKLTFGDETIADQTYLVNSSITIPAFPAAMGGRDPLTYNLSPELPMGLSFDASTRVLSGTPTTVAATATYTYTATDADDDEVTLTFMIAVGATDLIPDFALSDMIADQIYLENSPIDHLTLPVATGGNGTLTYSVTPALPASLHLDPATRVLSGTPDEGTAADAETYTYTATDSDGDATATPLTFMITIQDDLMPDFDSETIADQTYVEDSQIDDLKLPVATGGNGTLTYSLTKQDGSELPAGLRFDASTRVLSGTPTAAAVVATYVYTATDSDGDEVPLTFMITIQDNLMPDFGSASVPAQIYTVGATITAFALPEATGGNLPLTYSLTKPAGMSFDPDPANRMLSGAPNTAAHATNYTLTVTDADEDTDEFVFSVTVRAANATPIMLSSKTLSGVTASSTSDATITLTSTVAWEAAASSPGNWISNVDPAMGTGTNTAKTIALTYTANTGAERTGTVTFTETTAGANPKFSVTLTVTQAVLVNVGKAALEAEVDKLKACASSLTYLSAEETATLNSQLTTLESQVDGITTQSDVENAEAALNTANQTAINQLQGATVNNLNLTCINLQDADIHGVNMSNVNLSHVNMRRANIQQSTIGSSDLRHSDLTSTNLSNSTITQTNISSARVKNTDFSSSTLREVSFSSKARNPSDSLVNVNFNATTLNDVRFDSIVIKDVDFSQLTAMDDLSFLHCRLKNVDFSNLDFSDNENMGYAIYDNVNFTNANLSRANLQRTGIGSNVDFTNTNLENVNLSYANLPGVNLSNLNMRAANIRNANLSGANLRGTNLHSATIIYANLDNADLRDTDLRNILWGSGPSANGADFRGATFDRISFQRSKLTGANFEGVSLQGLALNSAGLNDANLRNANLSRTTSRDIKIERADLSGANLSSGQFHGAVCHSAIFTSVNAKDADFRRAQIAAASFQDANFEDAILYNADIIGGDLNNINLTGANLGLAEILIANIESVNFTNADLRQAVFNGVQASNVDFTVIRQGVEDPDGADAVGKPILAGTTITSSTLTDANFQGMYLVAASFNGSDCSRANFMNADARTAKFNVSFSTATKLNSADLRNANLVGTEFKGANLSDADLRGTTLISGETTAVFTNADLSRAKIDRTHRNHAMFNNANNVNLVNWE